MLVFFLMPLIALTASGNVNFMSHMTIQELQLHMPKILKIENSFISQVVNPRVETRSVYSKKPNPINLQLTMHFSSHMLNFRGRVKTAHTQKVLKTNKQKFTQKPSRGSNQSIYPIQSPLTEQVHAKICRAISPGLIPADCSCSVIAHGGLCLISCEVIMSKQQIKIKLNYLENKVECIHRHLKGWFLTCIPNWLPSWETLYIWQEIAQNPQSVLSFHKSVVHVGTSFIS